MDKKTQLLDENSTLEQRRKKDKVALNKVNRLKTYYTLHNPINIFSIFIL